MYTLPNLFNTPTSEIILNHLPVCFETFVLFFYLLVSELNRFSCSSSLNKLKPGCVFPYFVGEKTNEPWRVQMIRCANEKPLLEGAHTTFTLVRAEGQWVCFLKRKHNQGCKYRQRRRLFRRPFVEFLSSVFCGQHWGYVDGILTT